MNYEDIKRLIDDMGNSKIDVLDIEFPDGIKISMKKNEKKEVPISYEQVTKIPSAQINVNTQTNVDSSKKDVDKEESFNIVKSPMVGTFYSSPSPNEEPFVKVGDKVKKGDILCVVEAMKLMNEIESEFDGEIVEICVNNEDMVEYGKTLFKIK